MTTLTDLKAAYDANLAGYAPVTTPTAANDAFEIYVLTLALRAGKQEGAAVQFQSAKGPGNPSPLRFRTSPGSIYSRAHDYTHGLLSFPNGPIFEAHIGVYVQGLSGVLHECDIAIIDAAEASFCRNNSVHPKRAKVYLAAECKFYTGKLGVSIGREFLGITCDLGKEGRFLLSNSNGHSVDRVLAHHKRKRHFDLSPLNTDAEGQVVAMLREAFRDACATHR